MAEQITKEIRTKIAAVRGLYHRLILVVGPPRSGKTKALQALARQDGFGLISVNLELSSRLIELTARQRALRASALLMDLAAAGAEDVVLLDNLEILFDVSLQHDPLRTLQQLARVRTVVAAWNGHIQDGYLTYAASGHPEFSRYPGDGLVIVPTSP